MALNAIDPQDRYIDYTDRWAAFHKWTPRDGTGTRDADNQCCSQTYLERFVMTGDSAMLRPTRENLQGQMAEGKLGYWTWIDAIQMAMPVYAQMYKITGDGAYLDHAMAMYRWSRNECGGGLFNEEDGLWWRDADFVPPYKEKDGNQCYWSRGNGWVLAALVRVMDQMKPRGKAYKELKKDFMAMCNALAGCQREDGFWNVSLASPATYGGKETSGTALFLYGISWGLRKGYLKEKRIPPCGRQGLASHEGPSTSPRRIPRLCARHRQGAQGRPARHLRQGARLRRLWPRVLPTRSYRVLQTARRRLTAAP